MAGHAPTLIVTSIDRKAIETGSLIAETLHLPWRQAQGIEEHDRSHEPFEPSNDRFRQRIAKFFAQPSQLVYGSETADDCYQRFANAVKGILTDNPEDIVVIVSHGTVMSLFTSRHSERDAFVFWQRLQMPGFAVFALPDLRVDSVQYAITEGS